MQWGYLPSPPYQRNYHPRHSMYYWVTQPDGLSRPSLWWDRDLVTPFLDCLHPSIDHYHRNCRRCQNYFPRLMMNYSWNRYSPRHWLHPTAAILAWSWWSAQIHHILLQKLAQYLRQQHQHLQYWLFWIILSHKVWRLCTRGQSPECQPAHYFLIVSLANISHQF